MYYSLIYCYLEESLQKKVYLNIWELNNTLRRRLFYKKLYKSM